VPGGLPVRETLACTNPRNHGDDSMLKSVKRSALIATLCLATLSAGCYGPFNATQKFHKWNGSMGNKWGNEAVFLLTFWNIYPLCMLGDSLIFNSIEFWGGTNPITASTVPADGEMDQVAAVVGLPYSVVTTQAPGLAR